MEQTVPIKAVIFDCFGVLYGGSLQSFMNLCPPERLTELRDLSKRSDYGYISRDEYRNEMAQILDKPAEQIEDILSQKRVRNTELVDYVSSLRAHVKTAMLSNVGRDVMNRLFTDAEEKKLFDVVVLSYEENMTKPHPLIFALTAQRLGLKPEECVMVDDLAENCEGARNAGMYAIQHITNDITTREIARLIGQNKNDYSLRHESEEAVDA